MKKYLSYILIAVIFAMIGWFTHTAYNLPRSPNNPISAVKPTPLAKYTIENLAKTDVKSGQIVLGKILKDDPKFTSYEFKFQFSPDFSSNLKTTSGLINVPKTADQLNSFPVIVMFRGYVDPLTYKTGTGTLRAGEYFAQNGFVTIAPDFLGYGGSDKESENIFETRFQTYTTAIATLKSVNTIKQWDNKNIFIWGHSNGGQIALTVLEATEFIHPTVLWAPVSKPFPYSILYFTDEASDSGKFLRKKLSEFESNYDTDMFSLTRYLSNIKAPLQLNQGTNDEAVPLAWSNLFAKNLEEASVSAEYIKYPGADHNMNPAWTQAIQNALDFFKKHIQ